MLRQLLLCAIFTALAGCSHLQPVAASCPDFPLPPSALMRPPPTLDLVPPALRPARMITQDSAATPP